MVPETTDDVIPGNLTRAEYLLFQELIGRASGLNLQERDWTPLRAAVCERTSATRSGSFGEYYELLRSKDGVEELGRLIELLTIHETAFFRNRSHFDALTRTILPELIRERSSSRSLRIWSAGCATGQEAYSIAMALMETVPEPESWRLEVLATDISNRALEAARTGVYPARAVRNVKPAILDRYFEPCDGGYRVGELPRRIVRFEYLNLVKEPFPLAALSPFDIIFCENVTIYFKVESTRRVIRNFYDALRRGGYLFLGYSETLWQISDDFELQEIDKTFLYQKPREDAIGDSDATGDAAANVPAERKIPNHPIVPARSRGKIRLKTPAVTRLTSTFEEANSLYENRRFEEALLAVERVLAERPFDVRAHLLAAKLRADREEMGPALRHCRHGLEADPFMDEGHYLMGVLLLRAADYRRAAEALSRVIYLNPMGHRSALAHFYLAGLHDRDQAWEGAARSYRNALRLLERFPKDELVEEFSADFLASVCRRRLLELEPAG